MPGSLSVRDVSKSFAAVQVLDHVSLVVAPGDRIGIVGPNGIGKSTLLRVLAGLEQPDAGTVVAPGRRRLPAAGAGRARRARPCATTSRGARASARPSRRWTRSPPGSARSLSSQPRTPRRSSGSSPSAARTSRRGSAPCSRRWASAGAPEREVASLSGGEAARAALAAILLARFDVFLLDEPTNNLDFAGLDRLERFLAASPRAWCSSPTTVRSSTARSSASSRSRPRHGGSTSTRGHGAITRRPASGPGAARGRVRGLRRREEAVLGAARHPQGGGALARRRAQARAAHRRRRPARHERAAGQGEPGEEPPRAARGGREAVVALAARPRVRLVAADAGRSPSWLEPSSRSGRSRSARSTWSCTGATAWRSSGRTAPGRRP